MRHQGPSGPEPASGSYPEHWRGGGGGLGHPTPSGHLGASAFDSPASEDSDLSLKSGSASSPPRGVLSAHGDDGHLLCSVQIPVDSTGGAHALASLNDVGARDDEDAALSFVFTLVGTHCLHQASLTCGTAVPDMPTGLGDPPDTAEFLAGQGVISTLDSAVREPRTMLAVDVLIGAPSSGSVCFLCSRPGEVDCSLCCNFACHAHSTSCALCFDILCSRCDLYQSAGSGLSPL